MMHGPKNVKLYTCLFMCSHQGLSAVDFLFYFTFFYICSLHVCVFLLLYLLDASPNSIHEFVHLRTVSMLSVLFIQNTLLFYGKGMVII